jgi:hypothetical protein
MSKDDFELVRGSGNVFRDFAVPNADLERGDCKWLKPPRPSSTLLNSLSALSTQHAV